MSQTKKQSNGRGRPTKWFNLVKEKKLQEGTTNATRGRPKKVRKIDDSINTKIDTQRKSVSQLEKANKEIERQLWECKLPQNRTKWPALNIENIGFDDSKKADNFSLIVLICAMLFFIFALGKTFLYKTTMAEIKIHELISSQNIVADNEWDWEWYGNMDEYNNEEWVINDEEWMNNGGEEIINNEEEISNNEYVYEEVESNIAVDLQSNDQTLIYNFYNYINNLDFDNINASVDKYLRNSDVFRTYFTQNWLTRFKDKISSNGLRIDNITRKSWDENSTRYYNYTIHYELAESGESFDEDWELAVVNRNWEYLIWSVRCVTTGCSKMPFFQK